MLLIAKTGVLSLFFFSNITISVIKTKEELFINVYGFKGKLLVVIHD